MTLKEKRLEKGMTQVDLAIKVGVSLSTIRMWEFGVTHPNKVNQMKLDAALK
jgi:transcriptional regulator with XRE-family HTH domain